MTTIIINEKTKKGRLILDLMREMGIGKIVDTKIKSENIPNAETILAIQEAREGKTIKCLDFNDYLNNINHMTFLWGTQSKSTINSENLTFLSIP